MSRTIAPTGANFQMQVLLREEEWSRHLRNKTRAGLASDPPWIPPVWFYDEAGSELFERITRLPQYYPTGAEREILAAHADDIAALADVDTIVELGAGSSEKSRHVFEAGMRQGRLECIVPLDCSETYLASCAADLANSYPALSVQGVVADFTSHLGQLVHSDRRMVMFLGSTIGNFDREDRAAFLRDIAADQGPNDCFLLGTDLVKETGRLLAAYDDDQGVTARFNLNALNVMNQQLGSDFDIGAFRHRAWWDDVEKRIEMHLVATADCRVTVAGFEDLRVDLAEGRHLLTEYSTKFTRDQVHQELADVGLTVVGAWTDARDDFLVTLSRRV